ncbi:hypothetical protein VCHA53O466_140208 [Vibrio chagasii]|nr:hypothetical protein VCHA53O466_140208 [Vibrio chagasii]
MNNVTPKLGAPTAPIDRLKGGFFQKFGNRVEALNPFRKSVAARILMVEGFLKKFYAHYDVEDMRCIGTIRELSLQLASNADIKTSELGSMVEGITIRHRTPVRSQLVLEAEESNLNEATLSNALDSTEVFEDSYVVFGLIGLPLVATKVNYLHMPKLIERSALCSVRDVLDSLESARWASVYKEPCAYAPTRADFRDLLTYELQDRYGEELTDKLMSKLFSLVNPPRMRTVVISSTKPEYVPYVEDIKDWRSIIEIAVDELAQKYDSQSLDKKLSKLGYPHTYNLSVNLDDSLIKGQVRVNRVRIRSKVWLEDTRFNLPKGFNNHLTITEDDIKRYTPQEILDANPLSSVVCHISANFHNNAAKSIQLYREWKRCGNTTLTSPFIGVYVNPVEGENALREEIVKTLFEEYVFTSNELSFIENPIPDKS